MSASFLGDGQVDAPPAEGGGQDSDGTPLARLSSGHTLDEAGASPGAPRPPTDPRKDNASRLSVGVWVRKPGSVPAPASCASIAGWVRKPRSTGLHILTVAVVDEPALGRITVQAAAPDGILQRAQHQLGVGAVAGLPAHDPPRERVADRCQPQRPSPVPIRDRSATHSRLGAGAVKSRPTRSGAGVALGSWRVEQRQRLRRNAPGRPSAGISRATRLRLTRTHRGAAERGPWMPRRCRRSGGGCGGCGWSAPGRRAGAWRDRAAARPTPRRSRRGCRGPGGWARPRTGHDAR
jgi:hypothetical protein